MQQLLSIIEGICRLPLFRFRVYTENKYTVSLWGASHKICMLKQNICPTIHALSAQMLLHFDTTVRMRGFNVLLSEIHHWGIFHPKLAVKYIPHFKPRNQQDSSCAWIPSWIRLQTTGVLPHSLANEAERWSKVAANIFWFVSTALTQH